MSLDYQTIKYLAAFVTAAAGLFALFGDTHVKGSHKLTTLGWILLFFILASVAIGVQAVHQENELDTRREGERQKQYAENLAKQLTILSDLDTLSDTLRRLRVLSETTVARQSAELRRTSMLLSGMRENSATQASLLKEQRRTALDARRLLYPLTDPLATISIRYDVRHNGLGNPMRVFSDDVYTRAAEALRTWADLLRDTSKLYPQGGGRFARLDPDQEIDTLRQTLRMERVVIFGKPPTDRRPLSLDSVHVGPRSRWLATSGLSRTPGYKAHYVSLASPDVQMWVCQGDPPAMPDRMPSDTPPPDLTLYLLSPGDSGFTARDAEGRFSTTELDIDFVHGVIKQTLTTAFIHRRIDTRKIYSVLDLPGSTMFLRVESVCSEGGCALADSLLGLLLELDYGKGRVVRVPPSIFSHMTETSQNWYTGEWDVVRHHFEKSEIEHYPGEFADVIRTVRDSQR